MPKNDKIVSEQTTQKYTLTHSNKKGLGKSQNLFYGASNGLKLEPYYVEFLHLCLHDEETIEQVKAFLV